MKILIQGGTLIDPSAGTERQADVFIAAGRIVAHRRRARRLQRGEDHRRERAVDRAGLRRPLRAAARAGLRAQGDARIRNGRGDRGRRDEPRVSARHRSGARRARPRRDAQVSRAEAASGACVSARRADGRAEGRRDHRDGRADRGRLHRLFAGRFADHRHPHAACARCNTRPPTATPCGCVRKTRTGERRRRGERRGGVAARLVGRAGDGRDDRAAHHLRTGARHRRAGSPVASVVSGRASSSCAPPRPKGCR